MPQRDTDHELHDYSLLYRCDRHGAYDAWYESACPRCYDELRIENAALQGYKEDAKLFRRWTEEACRRPTLLANALAGCKTPDEYRQALRLVLLVPYHSTQAGGQ